MRRKPPFPRSFFNFTYSKLFIILLPLLIAVTLVSAAVFVYYPIGIAANWVEPPVRFQAAPGITTELYDDNATAVVDVTATGRDLVLDQRNAFIYDDYSTNPFTGGRLTTNTNVWNWEQGWRCIRAGVDGPAPSWGGQHVAYYANTTPAGTTVVYVLAKERHNTNREGQYSELMMINSGTRFYTLGYHYEDYPDYIEIWRYLNGWSRLSQTLRSLGDNTWFIFLGRRYISSGQMQLTVYDENGGMLSATSASDTRFPVNLYGIGLYDRYDDNRDLSAWFDEFVACANANPRYINVTQLQQGWTVYLESENSRDITYDTADSNGVASLDVLFCPAGQIPHDSAWIVRNGYLRIEDENGVVVLRKQFSVIVGGDVYTLVSVISDFRILDFMNFDSKPYNVSLRIESLNVIGFANSMSIWISSGSASSQPIRISNNAIVIYETSTITLGAGGMGSIYSTAVMRPSSTVNITLTFNYSLPSVEVEYLNSVTLRIHG